MKRKVDISHFFGKTKSTAGEIQTGENEEEQGPEVEVEEVSRDRAGTEPEHGEHNADSATVPGPTGNVIVQNSDC